MNISHNFTLPTESATHHGNFDFHGKKIAFSVRNLGITEDSEGEVMYRLICRKLKTNQDFLASDIVRAIDGLWQWAEIDERENAKHLATERLQIRVSALEKTSIEENSRKYGFSSVSEFLKTLGKNPESLVRSHNL